MMRRRSLMVLMGIVVAGAAALLVWRGFPASAPAVTTIQTEHFTVQLHTRRIEAAKRYMAYLEQNIDRVDKLIGVEVTQRPGVILYNGNNFPSGGLAWTIGRFDGQYLHMSLDPRSSGNTAASLPKVALHEYVHFLVHSRAGGRMVPMWLNEGIALYAAGQNSLIVPADELVPLSSINPSQSTNPGNDYGEALMAVGYIVRVCGDETIPALIDAYASGNSDALNKVCGMSEAQLVSSLAGSQPK